MIHAAELWRNRHYEPAMEHGQRRGQLLESTDQNVKRRRSAGNSYGIAAVENVAEPREGLQAII
jgi:hypothetical protein